MYEYRSPIDGGYKQMYLSKKKHNKIFPLWKVRRFESCDYFYKEGSVKMEKHLSIVGKCLLLLLFPIHVVLFGVADIKEHYDDFRRQIQHKKYGSFTSLVCWKKDKAYEHLVSSLKD